MHFDKADWGIFFLRVMLGVVFFVHGLQKWFGNGLEGATGIAEGVGFPIPVVFGFLLLAAEVLGGLLLIVGLWTRWAIYPLLIVMLVAIFVVHLKNGFFLSASGYEYALTLLVGLVSLLLLGESKISLGHYFFHYRI